MKKLIPLLLLFASCQKSTTTTQPVTVYMKAYLQGDMKPDGTMWQDLNRYGQLPQTEPYTNNAQIHTSDGGIVDWVYIQLFHDGELRGEKAAFIRKDGTLIDNFGRDSIVITAYAETDYYVILRHRNHLSVKSRYEYNYFSNRGVFHVDFSFAPNLAFGTDATVFVYGHWCMRAGDANADGIIKRNGPGNDDDFIRNIQGFSTYPIAGYKGGDLNMDGFIDSKDVDLLRDDVLQGSLGLQIREQLW